MQGRPGLLDGCSGADPGQIRRQPPCQCGTAVCRAGLGRRRRGLAATRSTGCWILNVSRRRVAPADASNTSHGAPIAVTNRSAAGANQTLDRLDSHFPGEVGRPTVGHNRYASGLHMTAIGASGIAPEWPNAMRLNLWILSSLEMDEWAGWVFRPSATWRISGALSPGFSLLPGPQP